ncbi:MAG: iron-containing alcohol dehydrogenase [Clostridiaceae bacterium]|jgi:alcohol dehydrogenase|nr:iron-containing alcohol dehydrogenase [Clostridiaceae bacterium]
MIPTFEAVNPVKIIFGSGTFARLDSVLSEAAVRSTVIVTLPYFLSQAEELLKKNKIYSGIFCGIRENPQLADTEKLIDQIRKSDAGAVVAIGGGSVIDGAKFAAALKFADGGAEDYFLRKKPFPARRIPLIAVPTTAGTGSEVTQVSVINRGKEKVTLNDPAFRPYAAIVDSLFTHSLPPKITAITGLDALAHALESVWSKNRTPLTDLYAAESARLIARHLETVLNRPNDADARDGMSYASLLAGLAFAVTKTAAVHACSYPLAELYGLPHGEACALTLSGFIKINNDDRLEKISREAGLGSSAGLAEFVEKIKHKAGLTTSLSGAFPPSLITDAEKHPLSANNPVPVTAELLIELFNSLK